MKPINGTFQLENGGLVPFLPVQGYFVSLEGYQTTIESDVVSASLYSDIIEAYRLLILSKDSGYYIGVWTDPEDGVTFIDLSLHIEDYNKALTLANVNNQIAFWDVAESKAIRVESAVYHGSYVHGDVTFKGYSSLSVVDALRQAKGMASRALNRLIA